MHNDAIGRLKKTLHGVAPVGNSNALHTEINIAIEASDYAFPADYPAD
jgi:hypothetical protein